MSHPRRFSGTIVLALASAAFGPSAHGVPVLDQEQDVALGFQIFSSSTQFTEHAQTFTAGITGTLTAVALKLGLRSPGGSGTFTVDIRNTEAASASTGTGFIPADIPGSPDLPSSSGVILATTQFDVSTLDVIQPTTGGVAGFTSLIGFSAPASVVAGEQYSILVRFAPGDTTDELVWHMNRNEFSPADAYAGGDAFYRGGPGNAWTIPNWDRGFRTYVEPLTSVPAPGSLLLVATAVLGMLAARQAQAKR